MPEKNYRVRCQNEPAKIIQIDSNASVEEFKKLVRQKFMIAQDFILANEGQELKLNCQMRDIKFDESNPSIDVYYLPDWKRSLSPAKSKFLPAIKLDTRLHGKDKSGRPSTAHVKMPATTRTFRDLNSPSTSRRTPLEVRRRLIDQDSHPQVRSSIDTIRAEFSASNMNIPYKRSVNLERERESEPISKRRGKYHSCPEPILPTEYDSPFESDRSSDDEDDHKITTASAKTVTKNRTVESITSKQADVTICVATLNKIYEMTVSPSTSIKALTVQLWNKFDLNAENCREETHIILLFNQRMHIFISENMGSVYEFLTLTNAKPHFYAYAIPKNQCEMYTYDTEIKTVLSFDEKFWNPVFFKSKQEARPRSILLSSLFAMRLLFQKSDPSLGGWGAALEAQFFLKIRQYMFPPAVLALKHLINEGCLFWFEKPLVVDSLIQMLKALCPTNIDEHDICDFVPLLFGWTLNQCDIQAPNTDSYTKINLIDMFNLEEKKFLKDPATSLNDPPTNVLLKEFEIIHDRPLRHVDVRSLTSYFMKKHSYHSVRSIKRTDYMIYDRQNETIRQAIDRLTEQQILDQYSLMAKRYPSLTLITRSAIRSDVTDQLVFLMDRTVAIVYKKKLNRTLQTAVPNASDRPTDIFEVFKPLETNVGAKLTITPAEIYEMPKKQGGDKSMPAHMWHSLRREPIDYTLSVQLQESRIDQITVILLDISRSMFEKRATRDKDDQRSVIDVSVTMLGVLSDNIVSRDQVHSFGLIHFSGNVSVICPITRKIDEFENALKKKFKSEEWTNMFDAIYRATSLIMDYERENAENMSSTCKKLIICVTDGIENHSKATVDQVKERLKNNQITLDVISFVANADLTDSEKSMIKKVENLCCEQHGYFYQNLPSSNIQISATFEQEAAIFLSKRDKKKYGKVEKPVHIQPVHLMKQARSDFSDRHHGISNYTPCIRRVLCEANKVQQESTNFTVFFCQEDILFWKIIIRGPTGTHYEGGHWLLYADFHSEYPNKPPEVRFVTEIYHVNVNTDGKICHQIFERAWSSEISMITVMEHIINLLKEPNFDDAISTEKAQLYKDQQDEYIRQVLTHTRSKANKSPRELREYYKLDD